MELLNQSLQSGVPVAVGILEALGALVALWVFGSLFFSMFEGGSSSKVSPPKIED